MAQNLPDDPTSLVMGVLGAIGTVATALGGAYVMVRKGKVESAQTAANTAQTTVQSTLNAMETVVKGLTAELERRQTELDELRGEMEELRKEFRAVERERAALDLKVQRQDETITDLKNRIAAQDRLIGRMRQNMNLPGDGGHDYVE